MLAMIVNENVGYLTPSGVFQSIASMHKGSHAAFTAYGKASTHPPAATATDPPVYRPSTHD